MFTFFRTAARLCAEETPFVVCTLLGAEGSKPGEVGQKMIVTAEGLLKRDESGTLRFLPNVGGGRVQARAIIFAQEMLESGASKPQIVRWNLSKDIGMTCGGGVSYLFEPSHLGMEMLFHAAAELDLNGPPFGICTDIESGAKSLITDDITIVEPCFSDQHPNLLLEPFGMRRFRVVVFGAGYVGNEFLELLSRKEDARIYCVDPRDEWTAELPDSPNIDVSIPASWEDVPAIAAGLSESDYVLCVTQGHSTDFPIIRAILESGRKHPFLGVIGSKQKRAVIESQLAKAGLGHLTGMIACPIGSLDDEGAPLLESLPFDISISVIHQILSIRAKRPVLPAAKFSPR